MPEKPQRKNTFAGFVKQYVITCGQWIGHKPMSSARIFLFTLRMNTGRTVSLD